VTPRAELRDELIRITRMLMGMSPAVAGDLPSPEPAAEPPPPEPAGSDAASETAGT
jgi:acetyl-CoA carboxylase carboxyl transferase subunit beta